MRDKATCMYKHTSIHKTHNKQLIQIKLGVHKGVLHTFGHKGVLHTFGTKTITHQTIKIVLIKETQMLVSVILS